MPENGNLRGASGVRSSGEQENSGAGERKSF